MLGRLYVFLIIFTILSIPSQSLFAAPFALEIEPVKLQANAEGTVIASYLEPCGAEFAGFLYQAKPQGSLEVAIVLRRYHARCSGLGGMQAIPLPMVLASNYATISSMDTSSAPLITQAVQVQNVHVTRKLEQTSVHAVYTSQCGQALGLLAMPEANGMRFNVLESMATHPEKCNRSSQILSVPGLDPTGIDRFHIIPKAPNKQNPDYSIRRVPVQLMSIDTEEAGSKRYQVYYLRRCNEAPIGLIQQNQGSTQLVAMLVAHYPAQACDQASPKKMWTAYEQALTLSQHQQVLAFRHALEEDLALTRPSSYRWNQATERSPILEVFSNASCSRDLGLVSHASTAGLAIGILQIQSSEPCNSPLKKVSYAYEMKLPAQSKSDVKPLQLIGS